MKKLACSVAAVFAVSVIAGCGGGPTAVSARSAPKGRASTPAETPAEPEGLKELPEGLSEDSIKLALAWPMTSPVPVDKLPDINYTRKDSGIPEMLSWRVKYEFADSRTAVSGIVSKVTIQGAAGSMPVGKDEGVITGKDANWHETVLIFATFQKLKGVGAIRLALFHPEVKAQKVQGTLTDTGRISNWVGMPVSFQ